MYCGGTQWRSWLRHSATRRKVVSSIPDCVIGIFHWHNPSGRIMAVGSTQHLTEMSTWAEGVKTCVGLTTLPPWCFDCLESGSLNLLEPSGPVQAFTWIVLPFFFYIVLHHFSETLDLYVEGFRQKQLLKFFVLCHFILVVITIIYAHKSLRKSNISTKVLF